MNKREYIAPQLHDYGTVVDVTLVGQTRPGGDAFPGDSPSRGKDGGSVYPGGLE